MFVQVQECLSLLGQGACTNYLPPHSLPPLHSALQHPGPHQEGHQLALVQLLLVNGADPEFEDSEGRSALEVAVKVGRVELVQLLRSWLVLDTPSRQQKPVSVKFHRYVFDNDDIDRKENIEPAAAAGGDRNVTPRGPRNFLESVANIFQYNVSGAPEDVRGGPPTGCGELGGVCGELGGVYEQLDSIGFSTPVRRRPLGSSRSGGGEFRCSTPRHRDQVARMDLSKISSIVEPRLELEPCRLDFSKVPNVVESLVTRLGDEACPPCPAPCSDTSSASFRTCESEVSSLAAALASSRLSVSQEFLIEDPGCGVSLLEVRQPSLLSVALEDQALLEQLQEQAEEQTGQRSFLATKELNRTYILERRRLGRGEKEVEAVSGTYPGPLTAALASLSSLTRAWLQLASLEERMAAPFNNLPDKVAESVKLLTRETACKTSFNYLLLDPGLTRNLPLRVFSTPDQSLWQTFVSAIFYIGKGSRSRPFHHLYDAVKVKKTKTVSAKTAKIQSIWAAGRGVVVVQIFHNTIAVEAFTREAAMIDAMGCNNLTNVK